MSLQIASLNSGSNANCYYIGNKNEAVLIDAGLSCRETDKRMKRLGLDITMVKAIFRGDFRKVGNRVDVLTGKQNDPFDSYEWMDNIHKELQQQGKLHKIDFKKASN